MADVWCFGFPCFPAGTLILTKNKGYIPIEEVKVGMEVLTHKGRWKKVIKTGANYGETVILKGNHYGLECTPNHPIYSSGEKRDYSQKPDGTKNNKIVLTDEKNWISAEEMSGKLWAVPNSVEEISIPRPIDNLTHTHNKMPEFALENNQLKQAMKYLDSEQIPMSKELQEYFKNWLNNYNSTI